MLPSLEPQVSWYHQEEELSPMLATWCHQRQLSSMKQEFMVAVLDWKAFPPKCPLHLECSMLSTLGI